MNKIFTCPHCSHSVSVASEEWEMDYNCPILVCPECKNEFLRENCKEIAISKISFDDKLPVSLWSLGLFIVGIVAFLFCFSDGGGVLIFRPKMVIAGIIFIIAGLGMAVSGIKNFKKKRSYLKEEKERSKTRCADANYTDKLISLGYKTK